MIFYETILYIAQSFISKKLTVEISFSEKYVVRVIPKNWDPRSGSTVLNSVQGSHH